MNDVAIKELNAFLKGQYMGIHAYEHLIQRVDEPGIKQELQNIQQEHKMHAMEIAERIQHLGGNPVDDEGFIGSMQNFISRFTTPDSTEGILESALKGEDVYGLHLSEEIVKGDLDPESKQMIERILDEDRKHLQILKGLMPNE
ncbi:ferritin-like domain-containing protein [Thalassobacillus devorans]|uniref:ferritin-like domain-containing protein n=1 Tax=Thalassobacillus devorans TaxID=279813 RepID=UPI0004904B70|nr:ferritin-like domain-containing protein [Thalassobacillus devorans]